MHVVYTLACVAQRVDLEALSPYPRPSPSRIASSWQQVSKPNLPRNILKLPLYLMRRAEPQSGRGIAVLVVTVPVSQMPVYAALILRKTRTHRVCEPNSEALPCGARS